MKRTLSIIIPVFNEADTIGEVLRRVAVQEIGEWGKEIIVVDDGSKDNSRERITNHESRIMGGLKIISHERNQGKGAAIKTALAHVTGEYVLIQDADLEYDPADWPALLAAAQANPGAAIYGSRNLQTEQRGYAHYVLGVWFLTRIVNLLFRSKLTDIYTGYKLIPTALFRSLSLRSVGFEFEAEVTTKILQTGTSIKEVPIHYTPRTFHEGKKIRWQDGLIGLWTILRNRFG